MLSRRKVLAGLIAAPAIVGISNIMPVRGIIMDANQLRFGPYDDKQWFRYAITYANGNYGEWTGTRCGDGCYDFGDPGVYIRKGDTLSILDLPRVWNLAMQRDTLSIPDLPL